MQKIIFETARDLYDQMKPAWKGNREFLLAQLIGVVEQQMLRYLKADKFSMFLR